MPQTGQERDLPRFRSLPCAVYLRAFEMPAGHRVEMHEHPWGQLMYAASGTLRASTERHSYLVPAQRALWIPPGVRHAAEACNPVLFRSLYLDRSLPGGCRVLEVSGLLRELLLRAAEFPREYPPGGEAERLMQVVADEVGRLREAPLNLPLPGDPRLRRITDALQADPADPRGISDWAGLVGASRRTLARLFREQTQLSFREWRQRLRLLNAVAALEEGASVTRVASDLGYDSTSAFISLFQRHFGQTPVASPAPCACPTEPHASGRRLSAQACRLGREVRPGGLAGETLAQVVGQGGDLPVVEAVAEAGHIAEVAGGRAVDAVEDDPQQVVRAVRMHIAVQRQGWTHAEEARSVAVMVAGQAGPGEQARAAAAGRLHAAVALPVEALRLLLIGFPAGAAA